MSFEGYEEVVKAIERCEKGIEDFKKLIENCKELMV